MICQSKRIDALRELFRLARISSRDYRRLVGCAFTLPYQPCFAFLGKAFEAPQPSFHPAFRLLGPPGD